MTPMKHLFVVRYICLSCFVLLLDKEFAKFMALLNEFWDNCIANYSVVLWLCFIHMCLLSFLSVNLKLMKSHPSTCM